MGAWRAAVLVAAMAGGAAQAQAVTTGPVPAGALKQLGVAKPAKTVFWTDRDGERLLVLQRQSSRREDAEAETEIDEIVLTATVYARPAADKPFGQRWQWRDEVSCEGLDIAGDFYAGHSQVLDLDQDGRAEVVVATHTFCGGGVDPQQIKIVVRQGERDYAVAGDSLIEVPGEAPLGGTLEYGPGWQAAPAAVKQHVTKLWQAVRRQRVE